MGSFLSRSNRSSSPVESDNSDREEPKTEEVKIEHTKEETVVKRKLEKTKNPKWKNLNPNNFIDPERIKQQLFGEHYSELYSNPEVSTL